jgi:UDP-GlcNAc:undecaprenyl-phosphate GlcNAc-1-phosphate transferase
MTRAALSLLSVAAFAAIFVIIATPLVRRIARNLGAVAYPKDDRWHKHPVPTLGGIAIVVGTLAGLVVTGHRDSAALAVIVAGAGMFFLGLVDDFAHLQPSTKLTWQIAVACVAIMLGHAPIWTGWEAPDLLLGILWIVMITNALNLLDNMDGLSAGIAALAALACTMDLMGTSLPLAAYAAAVAGGAAGFLVFNFKPASIFMGDSGSLFLGGSLAVLSLMGGRQAGTGVLSALAVPVFLLLIPIFDTTLVTFSRILSTRSASQGGRDHTSHRLVAMGFSESEAVLILWALAAAGGATAILGRYSHFSEALLVGPLLLIGLGLLGIQLARVRVYDGEDFSLLLGRAYTPLLVDVTYKRRIFEILLDLILTMFSYYAAYIIRFDREVGLYYGLFTQSLPIVIACQLSSLFLSGVYRGSWRYISLADLTTYAKAIALAVLSSVMVLVYVYRFEGYSRGVFVIDGMLLALLIVGSRLSFRVLGEAAGRHRLGQPVLIYGAGDGGALLLRELRSNRRYSYQPVAFLDDDPKKQLGRMLRLPILRGVEQLESAIAQHQPHAVIVSTTRLPADRLREVQRICYLSGTLLLQLRFSLEELPTVRKMDVVE